MDRIEKSTYLCYLYRLIRTIKPLVWWGKELLVLCACSMCLYNWCAKAFTYICNFNSSACDSTSETMYAYFNV